VRVLSRPDETPESTDVHATIDACLRVLWSDLRHRAGVVKDYGVVAPVVATEARLAQLFLDLLMAASSALPQGAASAHEIRITTRQSSAAVEVDVHRTGPAMSDRAGDVFDPFVAVKAHGAAI